MSALKPRHRRALGYLYFIGATADSPVKVGWSMGTEVRLSTLQMAHWETLVLLGRVRAAGSVEEFAHRELAEHRIRGEWFERGPALALRDRLLALEASDRLRTGSKSVAQQAPQEAV